MYQRRLKQFKNKKEIFPTLEECEINQDLNFIVNGIDTLEDLKGTIGFNGTKRVTSILQRISPFQVSREYARFGKVNKLIYNFFLLLLLLLTNFFIFFCGFSIKCDNFWRNVLF